MPSLPTPYPPILMDMAVRERRQQALASAEHARRLAQVRTTGRSRPAPVAAFLQAFGNGLICLGTRLQRLPKGSLGAVETAP